MQTCQKQDECFEQVKAAVLDGLFKCARDIMENPPKPAGTFWNPITAAQVVTGTVFRPRSPVEVRMLDHSDPTAELDDDRFDTCRLLGRYIPKEMTIEIYEKQIRRCAATLGVDPDLLREIVLIHELSHALVHLGVLSSEDRDWLNRTTPTDWDVFLQQRTAIFHGIDEFTHEYVAQALTCYVINRAYSDPRYGSTFERLM